MNQEIILARLCTTFAMLALLIACVGLYGTMSYAVARPTGEIGIRGVGIAAWRRGLDGVPRGLGAGRAGSGGRDVKPNSPPALILAAAILLGAALLAGYVPARKTSRTARYQANGFSSAEAT